MFEVVSQLRDTPSKTSATFALRRDQWDDYGYKTQYQLFLLRPGAEHELMGDVKILRKGQQATNSPLLQRGALTELGDDFCSVGQSFDYYERLAALDLGASR